MLLSYDFKDQVRSLEAGIDLIINDAPTLLGLVGMNGEKLTATKFEWMSDNLNSNRANSTGSVDTATTAIALAEGDGNKFRVNAIVVNGEEYMRVTAVNGDTITVVRGYDGTTAEAIDAGGELHIVARPQLQGAGPGTDEGHDRYTDYNYTQIIERYASVSRTQMSVRTHNVTNELNYQVQLRLKEAAREMNDWLIRGRRIQGSAGTPSTTGGLLYFSKLKQSATKNLAGGEITAKALNDLMEQVYLRGGGVNTILTNTAGARQLSKLAGNIVVQREDTTTGHRISTFVSDIVGGGQATVVVDPNMPRDKVVLFDRSILSLHALDAMFDEDARQPGADNVARQIRGEYGIKVKNPKEKIAVLENISTTVA